MKKIVNNKTLFFLSCSLFLPILHASDSSFFLFNSESNIDFFSDPYEGSESEEQDPLFLLNTPDAGLCDIFFFENGLEVPVTSSTIPSAQCAPANNTNYMLAESASQFDLPTPNIELITPNVDYSDPETGDEAIDPLIISRNKRSYPATSCVPASKADDALLNRQADTTSTQTCDTLFKCEYPGCSFVTSYKRTKFNHLKTHNADAPHTCKKPNCQFRTTMLPSLITHMQEVHREAVPLDEKFFKCHHQGCSHRVKSKSDLDSHMLTHNPEATHKCNQPNCLFRSTVFTAFMAHMLELHPNALPADEKLFKCDHQGCSHKVKSKYDLDSHMRTHRPGAAHTCNQRDCLFRSTMETALVAHLNEFHRNAMPADGKYLACEQPDCGFRAGKKYLFNKHLKEHGTFAFPCTQRDCRFKTSSRRSFMQHLKLLHPDVTIIDNKPSKRQRTNRSS